MRDFNVNVISGIYAVVSQIPMGTRVGSIIAEHETIQLHVALRFDLSLHFPDDRACS